MHRFYLLSFFFSMLLIDGFSQPSNNDPNQSYINVNTPKTPESGGFEKYGAAQVNEFTGASSVNIPVYTLKSRFLEVPINLSYQATGIRVNQEASWVGLGWDLIAGGRITVEIRGCADFSAGTRLLTSPTSLALGMQRIFNRLGQARENAVMTPSTICEDDSDPRCSADTNFDNLQAVHEMAQFGTGEPDIFRANFLGHSLTYYVDKVSNTIKFLGEQSFFNISYTLDGFNNITAWTIIDDMGVTYYFNQAETATNTIPANSIPSTTNTAWLLTKVLHPTGDLIQFTYTNYGYSVPAFTMNGWVNWVASPTNLTLSTDANQNVAVQSPYYLTRIESSDAAVDFTLDTRTDLYGPGSRKLSQMKVSDKITNTVKKTATFNYSYFQASSHPWSTYLSGLSYYLPSPLTDAGYIACSNSRLRLDSVNINLSSYQPPYRFSYNSTVCDKYCYGQDHWGYMNGAFNDQNGYSFTHLIPYDGIGGVQNTIPAGTLSTTNIGFTRDCNPSYVQAMILTNVTYPTGGSTAFTYEPHQSSTPLGLNVTGGGVRIKTIQNYESGKLVGTTNYAYSGGKYMGAIEYFTNANELGNCANGSPEESGQFKYSTNGAVNFNEILLGYSQITITQQSPTGPSNGSLVKTFNIATTSSNYSNAVGFDLAPPYFPPEEPANINGFTYDQLLDPAYKDFPPTPSSNLEGKLMQEQYFDSLGNQIKSMNHYYHLANYQNFLYDIRAVINRAGGFVSSCGGGTLNAGYGTGGNRPVYLFVSPAKSFHALEDSMVELTYSGSNFVKKKTAYQYNTHYQLMFESLYNSDGTQTIHYTSTSADVRVPLAGPASGLIATQMYSMLNQHILDLPLEQTTIHRGTAGDSTVISSRFNVYQYGLPLQVYSMESPVPLTLRTQFIPWYYDLSAGSSYSVTIDNHYKLYNAVDYSPNSLIRTMHTLQGNKAFIWDEGYNLMMAQCSNADSTNVAFSSFETAAKGGWTYNAAAVTADNTAPTGSNAFTLSASNTISISGMTSASAYIVSYWSKTGSSYTVTGSSSVKQGKTINVWTYFEHKVTGTGTITVSGTGGIDEVRLYPSAAQMTSYTYSPLFGITSQCDMDNRITYYFYDGIGRLKWIKDQDANIIKTFQYHYQGLPGIQY